jgi:hypothetical protein
MTELSNTRKREFRKVAGFLLLGSAVAAFGLSFSLPHPELFRATALISFLLAKKFLAEAGVF